MHGSAKKIWFWYIVVFATLMLLYNCINDITPSGEWDDYSFPIASILNDHNFSVDAADVSAYRKLFPSWSAYVDSYSLSGFLTRDGSAELAWYFPVYSIACIPFVLLLEFLSLPTIYTFPLTNLTALLTSVLVMYHCLDSNKKRGLLMVILTANPIVFYISWSSSEVFVYAMLVLGLTFWYNRWYKRAAVFVSIAGMMNPTIMSIGMIMILEYMVKLIQDHKKGESWAAFAVRVFPDLVRYGSCYIIGLIPMIYNFYHVGHINLTAALSNFTEGEESVFARVVAYLFDWNYGILPYFAVILCLGIVFLIPALAKRHIRYLQWMVTFALNVSLYSVMIHINCGMAGIARYNAWGVLPLIFAVVLFGEELVQDKRIRYIVKSLLCAGVVLTSAIVFAYGPYLAINTSYRYFTPVAEWVMNYAPQCYNPLHSTFNYRTNQNDGVYTVETPVVYAGEDGYLRKILAAEKDKDQLLEKYQSYASENANIWFADQVNQLGESPEYISLSEKSKIAAIAKYTLGTPIVFSAEGFNASDYMVQGLSVQEDWGRWTDGKTFALGLRVDTDADKLFADISCGVFNQQQAVTVYVNDQQVYFNAHYKGEGIQFEFNNPGAYGGLIELRFELPEAESPAELGYSADPRVLGLGLYQIVLSEVA